ncbi:cytochrome P450 [Thozetella sp. PMI_491]|nr:cytochrome P450 [Thozetella sp. PMI_491]
MQLSMLAGTVIAGLVACYLLDSYFLWRRVPSEPLAVRSRVPLVGHILSLLNSPSEYFQQLDKEMPGRGAFMLSIFGFKLYAITDRKLVLAVQRAAKSISFIPFSHRASVALSMLSPQSGEILRDTTAGAEMKTVMNQGMLPGLDLDVLNLATIQETVRAVDQLASQASKGETAIDLLAWVKHHISLAASDAWYGPHNPFRDSQHEADYWTFKNSFTVLVANIFPNVFAPEGVKAQKALRRRYEEYYHRGGVETASSVVQRRNAILRQHGMTPLDAVGINTGNDAALLGNLYPAAFWNIWNIFSRPDLLRELRAEVAKAVVREEASSPEAGPTFTLDISVLRTACPLLVSTFQETQRLNSLSFQIREVLRDTTVAPTDSKRDFLFKQGNMVQISGLPALHSKETWGPDADEFDAHRFIRLRKDPESQIVKPSDLPSGAFPVWGIAPHVCPARQWASTACMAMAALLILRLDVEPEGDKWTLPKLTSRNVSMAMPTKEVNIRAKSREEWNRGGWKVVVGQPQTRAPLAIT